jgi:hypothetical protein
MEKYPAESHDSRRVVVLLMMMISMDFNVTGHILKKDGNKMGQCTSYL